MEEDLLQNITEHRRELSRAVGGMNSVRPAMMCNQAGQWVALAHYTTAPDTTILCGTIPE